MFLKITKGVLFFALVVLTNTCSKGIADKTTVIIIPKRFADGRGADGAKIIFYKTLDSLYGNYLADIDKHDTILSQQRVFSYTDSLGYLTIVDKDDNIFDNSSIYYFYIRFNKFGVIYDNFDTSIVQRASPINFSTIRPIAKNSISRYYPYLYKNH